ncbi:O-antigen ligase family protein [Erythrobacter sp. SCSIO 43205]|uniref:O-antigen ligase family protein n=1 Tax=Erythrobacter sp. SCSIO 43205 TaxID=2779361 RepID=UPI001CA86AAD|nr:O-antigen ligase family protein [Erythrobacter sp. SCSIO 43205]UAB78990.1 O-antigen ligase family protein [Erythrobacter sp. SCSIO 43205]
MSSKPQELRQRKKVTPVPIAAYAWLAAFCFPLILLGGSSQIAMVQTTIMWPMAALFLGPVFYLGSREAFVPGRTLLLLLAGLALLLAVQAVPLPSGLWQALPGRADLIELENAVGLQGVWRPISWVPSRTLDALFSLIVPATALLLALSLKISAKRLFNVIIFVALADVALTIVQVLSGYQSEFYLYSVSSGRADGIFGNENHSGVFSSLAMLICGYRSSQLMGKHKDRSRAIFFAACFFIFLVSAIIGGSRAALASSLLATLIVSAMFVSHFFLDPTANLKRSGRSTKREVVASQLQARAAAAIALVSVLVTVGLFIWLDRSPSFDGILSQDSFEDLRWELGPILWEMIKENWLLGIGVGAFAEFYHIYEPTALLMPAFVNQAHNDWAQFVLEAGVGGIALLLALLVWIAKRIALLWQHGKNDRAAIFFWLGVFAIVGLASIVDYPLRTAIYQVTMVWLLLCLALETHALARDAAR